MRLTLPGGMPTISVALGRSTISTLPPSDAAGPRASTVPTRVSSVGFCPARAWTLNVLDFARSASRLLPTTTGLPRPKLTRNQFWAILSLNSTCQGEAAASLVKSHSASRTGVARSLGWLRARSWRKAMYVSSLLSGPAMSGSRRR